MPGTHLSSFERMKLETLLGFGLSVTELAERMDRSKSTVSRELRRHSDSRGRYCAVDAQRGYRQNRQSCKPGPKLACPKLRGAVEDGLRQEWSPEQIVGALALDHPSDATMRISHETIYRHVYADKRRGGTLYRGLRQKRRKRRNRSHAKDRRGIIKDRVPIQDRPAIVDEQARMGDWEGDTVIGANHEGAIATFVDRKSLYLVAATMPDKTPDSLNKAGVQAFKGIPKRLRHTLTLDNGKEFSRFKELEKALALKAYFADPYCSCQRAINENTNGLLRQYLPKKTSFKNLTNEELNTYVDKLNNRPRKKLGFRTPAQIFLEKPVAIRI